MLQKEVSTSTFIVVSTNSLKLSNILLYIFFLVFLNISFLFNIRKKWTVTLNHSMFRLFIQKKNT